MKRGQEQADILVLRVLLEPVLELVQVGGLVEGLVQTMQSRNQGFLMKIGHGNPNPPRMPRHYSRLAPAPVAPGLGGELYIAIDEEPGKIKDLTDVASEFDSSGTHPLQFRGVLDKLPERRGARPADERPPDFSQARMQFNEAIKRSGTHITLAYFPVSFL